MATLREQQLAEIRKAAKNGQFKKSDVKEISKSALTKGLAELVNSGELERVGVGIYSGSGAASSSSATPKKTVKQKAAKNKMNFLPRSRKACIIEVRCRKSCLVISTNRSPVAAY